MVADFWNRFWGISWLFGSEELSSVLIFLAKAPLVEIFLVCEGWRNWDVYRLQESTSSSSCIPWLPCWRHKIKKPWKELKTVKRAWKVSRSPVGIVVTTPCSKEPGESKGEHHSTDADHQTYDGFVADCFLLSSSCAPSVTNQHHNHPDEDNSVEYKYCNNGA